MKKVVVLIGFLASSTGYVFLQEPATVTASPPPDVPVAQDTAVMATSTSRDELLSQVTSLEANIAKMEGSTKAATAALALLSKNAKTTSAAPKPKAATTAIATATPARSTASSTSATLPSGQIYRAGNGALMNADGTPVVAPDGAQLSANGLWYSDGQAYEIPPSSGFSSPPASPAPAPALVSNPAPAPTQTVVAAPTPAPAPTTQTVTTTRRYDDDDDDDDDDD